jgi:hypothetical protein
MSSEFDEKGLFLDDEDAKEVEADTKSNDSKVVPFATKGKIKKDIRVVKIPVEGDELPLEIDVADAYFMAQLVKLVKYTRDVQKTLKDELAEADKIEDVIDRTCAIADINLKFSKNLKARVDDIFGEGTVEKYIGARVPLVYRYAGFFEAVTPYINEFYENERELSTTIANEYNI